LLYVLQGAALATLFFPRSVFIYNAYDPYNKQLLFPYRAFADLFLI